MSENILPIFSFMSFSVSYFVFKSLYHFEFMFVCGVRVFQPFVYTCGCPTFPAPLSEETIFSPLCILASFVEFQLTIGAWICFWCPYSVPLTYMYIFFFFANTMLFLLLNLWLLSEVCKGYASSIVLFSQDCFGNSGSSFCGSLKFRIICSSSGENVMGNLTGISLSMQIALGSMAILTVLILRIQEHEIVFFPFP